MRGDNWIGQKERHGVGGSLQKIEKITGEAKIDRRVGGKRRLEWHINTRLFECTLAC